jgi:hypothetical protein
VFWLRDGGHAAIARRDRTAAIQGGIEIGGKLTAKLLLTLEALVTGIEMNDGIHDEDSILLGLEGQAV